MIDNVAILIPARGGSKRIPKKNIINVGGKPLILHTINKALSITDNVYVSTDCKKIKNVCLNTGVKIIDRPSYLATDTADVRDTIKHFLNIVDCKIILLMQATSPLIQLEYIFEGLEKINYCDSVISVCEVRSFFWNSQKKPINYNILNKPRTQDMQPFYEENGAFYITHAKSFLENNTLTSGKVEFVITPKKQSIDIDTKEDLKILLSMI